MTWTRRVTVSVPTWRGWAVVGGCVGAALVLGLVGVHPFLAVNAPADGELLVVEGWLPDHAVPGVMARYSAGSYRAVVTTGGPLPRGSYLTDFDSYADLMVKTLTAAGLAEEEVRAVPAPYACADRTYESALALQEWLSKDGAAPIHRIDLVSAGAHARRSRLLFQMALGEDVLVGVIALPPSQYEAEAWWQSSAGVRTVIGELIAYLYVKLLFWP